MIKAIALDDEPLALKVIEGFCGRVDFIDLQKTFTKPSEGLKYLRKFPADLVFLDIKMPSISGIEFHKQIPYETMVIFTTAFSEFAVEGFNLNAVDYLLKPFSFERFEKAINKAKELFDAAHLKSAPSDLHLMIRADYSLMKIMVSEILFIESLDDYIKIHLLGRSPLVTRMTMKSILESLPPTEFIRVHRSFIVPMNKIETIRNKIIQIGENKVPIGSSYESEFFERFKG
ncbi:MAG: LytTR family DNA-binding domain-containing protein [Bacteroidetes bacterium]|nr:LytTR family DNA-binding domain-containing protein [Bacteroidota bacterium]